MHLAFPAPPRLASHAVIGRFLLAACAMLAAGPVPAQTAPTESPVEIVRVENRPLTFDVRLTGTIAATDSIELSFPAGGRITQVHVQTGDRVKGGEALARTDGVQQQQALVQALAGVDAAVAAEQQASQSAARAAELLRRGVGTRAAVDAAEQALSAAQGQLESARTAVQTARRAVFDTIIRAPQAAVVTARRAEPGQIVAAAQPILSLAAMTSLEAVFLVPDAPKLDSAAGARISLRPLERPEPVLEAVVTEIAPLVDPATGSVTVRAEIQGEFDPTLLGAAVQGIAHLPAGTGIEVPWAALTASGQGPAVWRVDEDGTVALAPVEIAHFDTGRVVLRSGLSAGDRVVGEGSQLMYPGRRVTGEAEG